MYLDSGIHVGDNSVEVVVSLSPFTEPGTLCSITLGIAGTKLVALVLPLANVPHPDAPSKKQHCCLVHSFGAALGFAGSLGP